MMAMLQLVLNPGLLSDGDIIRVDHSGEEAKEAEQKVDNHAAVVFLHQVYGEWRATEAHQVGQQVNVIQGEEVADCDGPAANAEEEVDPVLRITLPVQENSDIGEAYSKKSFHARHFPFIIIQAI